jgi:hypothetical protein
MSRDDNDQVERILKGFETLRAFLVPGRRGYEFRLKTSKVKSRAKSSVTVHHDDTTTISVAHEESKLPSFRAALERVSQDFYWEEPPEPAPQVKKTRKPRGTAT